MKDAQRLQKRLLRSCKKHKAAEKEAKENSKEGRKPSI